MAEEISHRCPLNITTNDSDNNNDNKMTVITTVSCAINRSSANSCRIMTSLLLGSAFQRDVS